MNEVVPSKFLEDLKAKQKETFHRCGTCRFAHKSPQQPNPRTTVYDCHGNPPTVTLIGVTPDKLGRPQCHIETFVPRVESERPACALYQDAPGSALRMS